jgi:hypothetical protein
MQSAHCVHQKFNFSLFFPENLLVKTVQILDNKYKTFWQASEQKKYFLSRKNGEEILGGDHDSRGKVFCYVGYFVCHVYGWYL